MHIYCLVHWKNYNDIKVFLDEQPTLIDTMINIIRWNFLKRNQLIFSTDILTNSKPSSAELIESHAKQLDVHGKPVELALLKVFKIKIKFLTHLSKLSVLLSALIYF